MLVPWLKAACQTVWRHLSLFFLTCMLSSAVPMSPLLPPLNRRCLCSRYMIHLLDGPFADSRVVCSRVDEWGMVGPKDRQDSKVPFTDGLLNRSILAHCSTGHTGKAVHSFSNMGGFLVHSGLWQSYIFIANSSDLLLGTALSKTPTEPDHDATWIAFDCAAGQGFQETCGKSCNGCWLARHVWAVREGRGREGGTAAGSVAEVVSTSPA